MNDYIFYAAECQAVSSFNIFFFQNVKVKVLQLNFFIFTDLENTDDKLQNINFFAFSKKKKKKKMKKNLHL